MPPKLSLREQLAEHRKQKAAGNYTRKVTTFGKVGETDYIEGTHHERPSIYGLMWLRLFGEGLRNQGVIWAAQVGIEEQWERNGKIRLSLQRVLYEEHQAPTISAGFGLVTKGAVKVPMGGGVWDTWGIPTAAVNAHDTAHVLKVIMSPKDADIVMAENIQIRAMHGR